MSDFLLSTISWYFCGRKKTFGCKVVGKLAVLVVVRTLISVVAVAVVGVLVEVGAFGNMWLRFWVKETHCMQSWLRLWVKAGDVFSYRCKAPRSRCTQSERSTSVATNNWPWISTSIAFARTSCFDQQTSRLSYTIIILQCDYEI